MKAAARLLHACCRDVEVMTVHWPPCKRHGPSRLVGPGGWPPELVAWGWSLSAIECEPSQRHSGADQYMCILVYDSMNDLSDLNDLMCDLGIHVHMAA
jgi:hypothetical protein